MSRRPHLSAAAPAPGTRRRPAPASAGVVARPVPVDTVGRRRVTAGLVLVLAAGGLLAGCGHEQPLRVSSARPPTAELAACRSLLRALPDSVADLPRRPVDSTGVAAAWGDPAIVLRCGVARPRGLTRTALCQQTNGVGWFIPPGQTTAGPVDIGMTTIGRRPRVEVRIPRRWFPPATTMVDLAPAVKSALTLQRPCS